MTESIDSPPKASERAAEWHREAMYHLARAVQEQRLAARSALPEAQAAHALLAHSHLARAGTAETVAVAPDAASVHDDRMTVVRAVMRESFGLPQALPLAETPSD